jgi:death-on-curing protein
VKFSEVVFLEVEEVELMHARALAAFGGLPGVRDRGMLESAVAAPQTTIFGAPAYSTIAYMAASLAHALVKNHAFVDGNKRVAHIASKLFLGINGYALALAIDPWANHFWDLASGALSREDFAGLLAHEIGRDEPIEED